LREKGVGQGDDDVKKGSKRPSKGVMTEKNFGGMAAENGQFHDEKKT